MDTDPVVQDALRAWLKTRRVDNKERTVLEWWALTDDKALIADAISRPTDARRSPNTVGNHLDHIAAKLLQGEGGRRELSSLYWRAEEHFSELHNPYSIVAAGARRLRKLSNPLPAELIRTALMPATTELLDRVVAMDAAEFLPDDCPPLAAQASWLATNNHGWVCAVAADASKLSLAGYFSVLFPTDSCLERLVAGAIREADIGPDDLVPAEAVWSARSAYVCAFVVRPRRQSITLRLLLRLGRLLERLATTGALEHVYAMAATDFGTRLVEDFDFVPVSAAATPTDQLVYRLDLCAWLQARRSQTETRHNANG